MTRPPQGARQRRTGLSVLAIRLGLLALVSYPVFPWSAPSTVGAADAGGSGPRPTTGATSPPTADAAPCLTITGIPGAPLSLGDERCGSGGGGSTGAWGTALGSYPSGSGNSAHRDGVAPRRPQPDPLRDRARNPWSQSRPFVGDIPPRKARPGRTPG
ncbi:hypothetical protein ACI2K4_01750 [Micromonospora sp. NPDC050397]|uniref:hypothetical protein n=1 Tax=Micromonospora sp. NPDC050397 TaxID=3364279 RepID=UPI00384ECD51